MQPPACPQPLGTACHATTPPGAPLGWALLPTPPPRSSPPPPPLLHGAQGGVRDLLRCLKQHCRLARAAHDPNTYLLLDAPDPLARRWGRGRVHSGGGAAQETRCAGVWCSLWSSGSHGQAATSC